MKTDAQIELNISRISFHAAYMRKKPLESFYYYYFFFLQIWHETGSMRHPLGLLKK